MCIQHVNNRLAKNLGILNKLRYYVSISTLRQLYYNHLIYPYISYGLISWGTASQSRLQTLKRKQNKCIRSIFFASHRETASIYYKLLEIHTLDNVFNTRMASFIYIFKHFPDNTPGVFHNLIIPASKIHTFNTRYASRENLYRPVSRTNYGLSSFTPTASNIWENIPYNVKTLPFPSFIKPYSLTAKYNNYIPFHPY